jgi:hypothetical protein
MTKAMEYATHGEQAHARALVRWLLNRNLSVQVKDEEETLLAPSTDEKAILAELAHSGENFLRAFNQAGDHVGTFYLIWGNDPDGSELVADCSANDLCDEACDAIAGAY